MLIKKPIRWAACLAILYVCACLIALAAARGRVTVYMPRPSGCEGAPSVTMEGEPLELCSVEEQPNGLVKIVVRGQDRGDTDLQICWPQKPEAEAMLFFRTGPLHMTMEMGSLNFSGCRSIVIFTAAALILLALILLSHFFWRLKNDFYSYRTAFTAGMTVYCAVIALLFLYVSHDFWRVTPAGSIYSVLSYLGSSGLLFMYSSSPFLLLMCAGLFISNAALLRHEGARPANFLAAAASLAVIGGFFLANAVNNAFTSGSFEEYRLHSCLTSAVATCFVFMEAMLLGAMICGLIAALREPDYDRDYIIIHGCQIARDGAPLPLLRGRIDRALQFAARQKEKTGREAVFIPSGGQGKNECVSEGRSIADYLAAHGVPESRMLVEDQSVNTLENMRFSKQIIDEQDPRAKVAFSTTNYHVFRSGVLAQSVGLDAQGMGSPTKWYFWPNAFIREFIGLLVTERKAMIILLAEMVVFFTLLTYFSAF